MDMHEFPRSAWEIPPEPFVLQRIRKPKFLDQFKHTIPTTTVKTTTTKQKDQQAEHVRIIYLFIYF